jgi:outer membrane protein assembly factor BamD (BamD/ComL family)
MGGKRAGKRKQIHLYIAILILLSPLACTLNKTADTTILGIKIRDSQGDEVREHLTLARQYLAQGNYGNALKEHEKVIPLAGDKPPADESLFYMGLIYAHPANPAKDFGKSIFYCRKLIKDYPKSSFVEQAKAIMGILQENDKLNRLVERLNTIIEESKQVDIGIEQRKRIKAK